MESGKLRAAGKADGDPAAVMRWRQVEREAILAELVEIGSRSARGERPGALIEGPAGIGKTTLLRSAIGPWSEDGIRVLTARGGEIERDLPWSVVRELLGPVLQSEGDAPFSGMAALARPVVEGTGSDAANPEAGVAAALNGLYWLLAGISERQLTLLVIDDAHWMDPQSRRFLGYLVRRLRDLPLGLVVATRPEAPAEGAAGPGRLGASLHPLAPAPLSEAATGRLLELTLGRRPEPAFTAGCHRLTGGNPFLVRELTAELRSRGISARDRDLGRLEAARPESVGRTVGLRLAPMTGAARSVAHAVAVLESSPVELAARLTGLSVNEAGTAADELAEVEVLAPDRPLRFAHPLVRSAVHDAIPTARRAELHRLAAEELGSRGARPGEIAIHLAATEPVGDDRVVTTLRSAAVESLGAGAPGLAASHLRRALAEPPPGGELVEVLIGLAEAEAVAGEQGAVGHLQQALAVAADPRVRARASLRLGWMLCRCGRLEEGSRVLHEGIVNLGEAGDELAVELEAAYLANAWQVAGYAIDVERRQREFVGRPSLASRRALLSQGAMAKLLAGADRQGVVDDCRELLATGLLADETADSLTFWIAVGCLNWADAFEEAGSATAAAFLDARRRGSPYATAWAYYARSWPRLWSGRVSDAAADATAAVEAWSGGWGMYLPVARYWLAQAEIERGDLAAAGAALELADPDTWSGTLVGVGWALGRGELAAARGAHADAAEMVLEVGRQIETEFRIENPSVFPWRSIAARCLTRLDRRAEARALAGAEVEQARRFGAPRALGAALRAAGIARGGRRGVELLRESVAVLEASPAALELARSRVDLGMLIRHGGEPARAREPLAAALDAAAGFGALALARRAEEELRAAGARPRRRQLSGPDSLTPAERRVAELAAGGQSNREVAQQLFVSLRTVETHLTHVYGKLDIDSRARLAAALAGEP